MDSQINEFDILLCFAGVKTKEGQDFINCIEDIQIGGKLYFVFRVTFKNKTYIDGEFMSVFRFNPSYSHMVLMGKFYKEYPLFCAGTPGYWKEFRKVVKDVASFYEF